MPISDDFIRKYLGSGSDEKEKKSKSSVADSFIEKYNPTVDENYINSFLSDFNSYSSKVKTDYDGLNWHSATSSGMVDSYKDTSFDLAFRSGIIRSHLYLNRDSIEEADYNGFVSQLDEIDRYSKDVTKAFSDARDYYSQWETQQDYDDYVAYQKDYEEKKNFDLNAGQKEIDELKAIEKEYNRYSFAKDRHPAIQEKYQQLFDQYGDIKSLRAQISEKTAYLNQAKRIQEGITMGGVVENADFKDNSGYVSTEFDSRWKKATSQYGLGYEDLTYEYINGSQNGMRDEILSKNTVYNADNALDSRDKWTIYDNMTESEIAIYNYHYAKDGKEAADNYLKSIQETLNLREATSMYGNMEDKTALELAFKAIVGLDQFESGVKNLLNTEDDYIPQSAYQIASGMVDEDLDEVGPKLPEWLGGRSLGRLAGDAISTTANMVPSIMTSWAIGMINPVAGKVVGAGLMGASASGNDYQQMLNLGYSKEQARIHSTLVGASEAGLQYFLGGIGALGGEVSSKVLTNFMNGIDNAILRTALKLAGNMASEGFEEGLQEIMTTWFTNLTMYTDEDVNWSEVAYSSLLGALTAGFMEGGSTISGEVGLYKTGKQLQAADISAQRLAEIGSTLSADTVAYQLAGRVNEKTGAYTMGRLFNEIGAEVTEQNKADIQKSLERKGMSESIARKNAEVFAEVVAGGTFSEAQIAIIEANESLAKTVNDVIINPNSTVNQRSKGYNEVLMALAKEKTAPKATSTEQAKTSEANTVSADNVDIQNEHGSEVDTSPAKAKSFSSIKKGEVTIKLEDGSEVNLKEADLDPNEGVAIETIASIEGISAEDANFILNTLRTTPGTAMVASQMSSLGAKEAYKYGYYGFSEDHITRHGVFANSLTETQRKAIYKAGQETRAKHTAEKQATVAKNATTTNKDSNKVDNKGRVHFEGDRNALKGVRKESFTAMEKIAEALGLQIYVFKSYVNEDGKLVYKDKNGVEKAAPNGWYDPKDSSIHIDINAGAKGQGFMLFTLAHELTHHIRKWSPAKFKVLADFLMEEYGKQGVNVDALVRMQMDKAKRNGRTISYDTAYEEVVADSMEAMLADGNVMNRVEKLKAKDKDLWHEIKRFVNDFAEKIRKAYKGLTPDSVESMIVSDMGKAVYKLQELFAEALVDAGENYQASITASESETLTEAGIGFDEDTKSVYSLRYSTAYQDVIQVGKKSFDTEAIAQIVAKGTGRSIDDSRKWVKSEMAIANIVMANPEFLDFEADNRYEAIKKNSDYPQGTVDLSNLCPKREEFTAMFDKLQKKYPNKLFTAQDIADMRKILAKNHITVACGACFVEDRRQLIGEIADTFIGMWKEAAETGKPLQKTNAAGKKIELLVTKALAKQYGLTSGSKIMATDTYIPNQYDLTTYEGFKLLEKNHPTIAMAFNRYNNSRGQQSARLIEGRAEYNRQILGWTDNKVKTVNNNGGLRIFSFSDFEVVHLLDLVQVIIDCSARGVKIQGYTKIPAFAKLVRNTGIKLNRSLIPKGDYGFHMENGKVVLDFDNTEGINRDDENFLDESDNPNVGNVLIGINPTQIGAAFLDPFVDYIIPFHSNKAKAILKKLGTGEWVNYKESQHEKDISTGTASKHNVNIYTQVINKYHPTNKVEFVDAFLKECKRQGKIPRYAEFLNVDENGDYAYREGYHKLLVDFKMFDKDGNILPQGNIAPNMDEAFMKELLESEVDRKQSYQFPQAVYDDIDKQFGEQVLHSDRDNAPTFYSQMAKVVDGVKQEKLGASSVVSMLRGKGVKAEEIKWSGIEEWLEGKKSVTKAELQEFIAGSMLQIEEETLSNEEIPYTADQQKRIDEHTAKRDEIAQELAEAWKQVTGDEIPITYFGAGLESAVESKIRDVNLEEKKASFEGRLLEKLRKDLKEVIANNDDFGFDSGREALISIHRHRRSFIDHYELSTADKAVIVKYCNALNAYNELPNKINDADTTKLRRIAHDAELYNRKIGDVKSEHYAENAKHMTKWGQYKLKGGTNYRELLFKIPGSSYYNDAMAMHWEERNGVLAHARIQDLNTFLGKMLFVEEIQSDWHNAGHKGGYITKEDSALDGKAISEKLHKMERDMDKYLQSDEAHDLVARFMHYYDIDDEYRAIGRLLTMSERDFTRIGRMSFPETIVNSNAYASLRDYLAQRDKMIDEADRIYDITKDKAPDAPFKDTYHEYVLKRLLREAAENDYDSIGWTPSEIQVKRWSKKFEEGYRIEYDQEIPKFMNKYGKKWGTKVGKTVLDSGTEVWSMAITDEMKESVLTEGQPLYSDRIDTSEMDVEAKKIISSLETRARFSRYSKGEYASYSTERIERELSRSSATKMDYAKSYIAWVNPDDFLYATTTSQTGRDQIEKEAGTLDLERLREQTQPIHLTVDFETGKIVGHEGRHRMTALRNAGVEKVAVIFDAWNDDRYNTKPVSMMRIGGQEFDRYHGGLDFYVHDMLPLSRRYADAARKLFSEVGGSVKFSERDTESVSNRSLLANAFEGVAQNDIERNKIQEYKSKIDLINAEEKKLRELNAQIKELSFGEGKRDTKKLDDLRFDAQQAANRINTFDKQLLRLEASKPLQDVLTREKKRAYNRAMEKGKEAQQAYRDRSVKTQMVHKIQRVVGDLNKLLLHGDKKHHVPENLKKAVADALALVNMDTVGAEERVAYYANLIAKEQAKAEPDQAKIDAYTATMENIKGRGEKMGQRLKELRDAYEEIQGSDDPDIANAYDPVIAGALNELSQSIGNTSLRNMTLEQLSDVYDVYRMVLTRVRDANKAFFNEMKENISNLASRVIGEVRMSGGEHKYRAAILDPARKFLWNNLKPVYAMEHIGSSTLANVFGNVRAGEDVWAKDVTEARDYYLDKSKKYGYDSWDFKKKYSFESNDGTVFELTLEQILSLYAYSKREQAHDHLRLGGFVFDSNIETYKDKGSKMLKYKVNTADAHQITPEILANIIGKLSDNQKAFVDEMQDYLSTTMGAKGNEVTMKMYGVKLFKEKFYFPLKSAKQFMFEQNQVSGEVKIKNSGFTNKVVAKANNPVILSNFMDVWSGHVNDMSMYHAFVLPLEDFNRVFNYNSPKKENQPSVSVKGTIQNAYSPAAVSYVKDLITDLNGGARGDTTTGFINKMMGLFKKGSVFASLSVVVQQPSAIARAVALVDTKYFIGPKVDHKRHKALWDEVKQYAPVAIIKEMGYFDTNMGKSTQDFITGKEYSGFKEKMKALVTDSGYRDEVLSKAPALADEMAWCSIWEAVKREMHDQYKGLDAKSEPFLMLCGSRFTEVITKTQVYDSVLSRSANMRSKDTGMKMATAFMAEPTTSINMIADALLKGKRGNRKYARKAIGAVIASQILNSILVSFVYAGRDDDEDETYLEKYIGTLSGEVLDSLNPAGYIPFIKDIVSIVQGYDVERSDMAVVSDLWKAWQNLSKDNVSVYRKVEGFAGSIAQIFGLPVKNIMRDARGIYQTIDSFVNGQQTTRAGIGYAIKGAITGKDVSNTQQLYEARMAGDEAHEARVESRYEDEDSANAAVRASIKNSFVSGEIDTATALKHLVLYAGMDGVEAYWLMDAWQYNIDNGSDDGYSKYEDFYEAVKTGKNLKTVIKQYTDNGVEMKTLKSQITSHFKPQYIKMSTSERTRIKGYLLNAMEQCGVNREDAENNIAEWQFEADYPELSEQITFTQYKRWQTDGQPHGVSLELYTDVSEFRDDGTSASAKSQDEVAAYIDSLPISTDQKDALWCCFWKESTLKKAPWH